MLEYDRIDISEGIDLNKTNKSKECMLCHHWYLLNKNFYYGSYLCDSCGNMTQKYDIVYVKGNACRIHFLYVSKHKSKSKRKAISLMTNSSFINKKGIL